MSCSKCGSTTAGCGCKDTAYTTPMPTICVPACPPKCAEYISATCVLMQDGIDELGSNPGDTLESLIQRLTLIITNPLCVDWNPGSGGGGGGGGGIVSVGLVAPSNLFETPITPVTTPGGDLTLTLNDQSSNTVFAGPTSGPANTPQFRALVIDDLPALTTGTSVLMGDGAGKFANVTIGPNLSFSGGVLDANINVVIGADNGLTKDPINTDTVWLGGPSTDPGVLIQDTFIDTTDQYRLNLYGDNPAVKRGVLEVEHNDIQIAVKAIADNGTAVSANIIDGVTAVYASSTGSGIGLTAESSSGNAIVYNSDNKAGIIGDSKDENIFNVISTTAPADSTVSSVLRLTKKYNSSSAIGIGSRLDFGFYNSANADKTSATIASVTTAVTASSETADLRFSTIGNGTLEVVGEFIGGNAVLNGQFRLNKYGINSFGTGTPIYGLAVDNQGYVLEVPLASGLGTVDNGLRLNPSLSTEVWLGGTLIDPAGTTITVPDGIDFTISGATTTIGDAALVIENTAGATGANALRVLSGGSQPAVNIISSATTTAASLNINNAGPSATAFTSTSKGRPALLRTDQTANTTQVEMLKLHNQSGGGGGNGIGGYISLAAATVSNSDQEAARITYQFTDATSATRKGQLEFSTANPTLGTRMIIKETGQIQFNNYTTATSFTTTVGASLLGVDTSGNVINSSSTEGILFNPAVGQVQLGYLSDTDAALAGNKFSVNRFLYTDDKTLTIDGIPSLSNAVLRVQNKTLVNSNATYGIWASNGTGVSRNAYAIYGQGGSVGGGVIGTTTNVNTGDGTRSFGGDFGIISSNSTPSQLVRTPLRIFSTRVGGGVVNHGTQMLFQLSDDVSTSFDAGTIGYITTSPTSAGDAETSTFFVSNKEAGIVNPVNKLEVNSLGQVKFNKYTTSTSFTTTVGTSLLGVDTSGSIVNSVGAEGLSFNSATANIELGKSSLSGTSDLTGARFINTGTNTINLSGAKKGATADPYSADTSPAVIRGINTATTILSERSIGILGSASGDFSYGVYGSATGSNGIGIYGRNTTGANGIGVYGTGTQAGIWGVASGANSYAIRGDGSSASNAAVYGTQSSAAGYVYDAVKSSATAGQITPSIRIDTSTSGVGSNGQGSAIDYRCGTATSGNSKLQTKLAAWWSDATTASSTANFTIYVADAGAAPSANITFAGNGGIQLGKTLPTSASGLNPGDLYTQTATELGGSGAQKVICIV